MEHTLPGYELWDVSQDPCACSRPAVSMLAAGGELWLWPASEGIEENEYRILNDVFINV